MLEKLLQAAAITLLLSLLTGIRTPKAGEAPSFWTLQPFSLPLLNPQLHTTSASLLTLR